MEKILIVIDMQNDFITGSLGSVQAQAIIPAVKAKIERHKKNHQKIIFTRDTHYENYLKTQEGNYLPIEHCIKDTFGYKVTDKLELMDCEVFDKTSFGSIQLADHIANISESYDEIELCGLCTDICVVSNALIMKARLPEMKITVDAQCCAGVTEESHKAALLTMKMCQVNIINE